VSLIYINTYKTQPRVILQKTRVFAATVTDDIIFLWFIQRRLISFEVYSAGEQRTIYRCNNIIFFIYLTMLPVAHYGASNM